MHKRPSEYDAEEVKAARTREKAREKILKKANQFRSQSAKKWGKRHIYQAVRVCRVWGLVPNKTLIEAGFHPVQKNKG